MRKYLLMLTLMLVFFLPTSVMAQNDGHISQLSVDIWPEYDQPAVLMIYRISFAPNTALPFKLAIRIPAEAQINAVALADSTNKLINTPYNVSMEGKFSILEVASNSLQVQVEYYVPLVKDGTIRHIVFNWAGEYPVDNLEANFLRPFGATNVSLSLAPASTNPGQDGLLNYLVQTANLSAGQPFSLAIDYQRQTDDLSISSLPVQAVSTPGPETPGRISMTGILPWLLGGIGVLLFGTGIVWFVVWQRGGQGVAKEKRHKKQRVESDDEFIYCHQCGKRAHPGDVFCRTCGTRLKRGSTD